MTYAIRFETRTGGTFGQDGADADTAAQFITYMEDADPDEIGTFRALSGPDFEVRREDIRTARLEVTW